MSEALPTQPKPSHRGITMPVALFLLVVAVVLVIGSSLFQTFWANRHRSNAYQAVFLTSGQVYFGKLEQLTEKEIVIVDVYYLQATDNPQQASGTKTETNANINTSAATAPQYSLIKLGGELHGPQDRMYINRSQVLFTEDLKDSSQVVTAIRQQK
ncbi:MAG: hypothetical protein Q8O51_01440 [bacterium]|nr:hypothetical protein [bacterium]